MSAQLKPAFIHDKGSYERIAYGSVLIELKKNFMPLDPSAEERLFGIVQGLCEECYEAHQLLGKWRLQNQGIWVEPSCQPLL